MKAVSAILVLILLLFSELLFAQRNEKVRLENPAGLSIPKGYSHVAVIDLGHSSLLFMSGQVALDSAGSLIGPGNMKEQAMQVFRNIRTILKYYGGNMHDLVKLSYFITDISAINQLREARDLFIDTSNPPASTLVEVKSLFRQDILLEVEATAVVPHQ